MAYHLFLSLPIEFGKTAITSLIAFSNFLEKISLGKIVSFFKAILTALSISISNPVCFNAEVSIIGQFNKLERRSTLISIFCFFTKSTIFKAITTGIPVSINCVVKYRFLSILVASTKLIITSGLSFNK